MVINFSNSRVQLQEDYHDTKHIPGIANNKQRRPIPGLGLGKTARFLTTAPLFPVSESFYLGYPKKQIKLNYNCAGVVLSTPLNKNTVENKLQRKNNVKKLSL